MEILFQLGLNKSFFPQLAFFLISGFFLTFFLFRPYLKIIEVRRKKTTGASEHAAHLIAATEELAMDYEGKVRTQNEKLNEIFAEFKKQGNVEEEKILSQARTYAQEILNKTQQEIAKDLNVARRELEKQIPILAGSIASKVLGREIGR